MINIEEITTLKVVKRNGRKVDFDGAKIAMAIKKGFDSVENAQAYLTSELFKADVFTNLQPLWIGEPEVRIYSAN